MRASLGMPSTSMAATLPSGSRRVLKSVPSRNSSGLTRSSLYRASPGTNSLTTVSYMGGLASVQTGDACILRRRRPRRRPADHDAEALVALAVGVGVVPALEPQ